MLVAELIAAFMFMCVVTLLIYFPHPLGQTLGLTEERYHLCVSICGPVDRIAQWALIASLPNISSQNCSSCPVAALGSARIMSVAYGRCSGCCANWPSNSCDPATTSRSSPAAAGAARTSCETLQVSRGPGPLAMSVVSGHMCSVCGLPRTTTPRLL